MLLYMYSFARWRTAPKASFLKWGRRKTCLCGRLPWWPTFHASVSSCSIAFYFRISHSPNGPSAKFQIENGLSIKHLLLIYYCLFSWSHSAHNGRAQDDRKLSSRVTAAIVLWPCNLQLEYSISNIKSFLFLLYLNPIFIFLIYCKGIKFHGRFIFVVYVAFFCKSAKKYDTDHKYTTVLDVHRI